MLNNNISNQDDHMLKDSILNKNDSKSLANVFAIKKSRDASISQSSFDQKPEINVSIFDESNSISAKNNTREKKVKLKSFEQIQLIDDKKTNNYKISTLALNRKNSGCCNSKPGWLNYSCIVLIASFISFMLASVLSCCFGVFFESMEADMGWSKSQVAFIGGFISALQDLCGPIASAMTNRFGCRKTCMFGGLIAGLGLIGGAFSSSRFWLFAFLIGGVSGFGSSLVLVSSVVVVTYYFEEKPSFASGVTISGSSLGQSIFSIIIIKLNEVYGKSGCFLILGGILLNIVVCGALFRPLKWELEDDDDEDDEEDEDDEIDDEDIDDEESNKSNLKLVGSENDDSKNAEIEKNRNNEKLSSKIDLENNRNDNNSQSNINKCKAVSSEQFNTSNLFINNFKLVNSKILSLTFDSNSNMNNFDSFVKNQKSTSYSDIIKNNEFSSDSCLMSKISKKEMSKVNNSGNITESLDNINKLYNSKLVNEITKKQKNNSDLINSNLSLNKCRSLLLSKSDRKNRSNYSKNKAAFSSNDHLLNKNFYSSPNYLNNNNYDCVNLKRCSSKQINISNYDINQTIQAIIEQKNELDNIEDNLNIESKNENLNDFVIVDANEIVGYDDSNLIINSSPNAIYFPLIDNNNNNTIDKDNNNNNLTDEVIDQIQHNHYNLSNNSLNLYKNKNDNSFILSSGTTLNMIHGDNEYLNNQNERNSQNTKKNSSVSIKSSESYMKKNENDIGHDRNSVEESMRKPTSSFNRMSAKSAASINVIEPINERQNEETTNISNKFFSFFKEKLKADKNNLIVNNIKSNSKIVKPEQKISNKLSELETNKNSSTIEIYHANNDSNVNTNTNQKSEIENNIPIKNNQNQFNLTNNFQYNVNKNPGRYLITKCNCKQRPIKKQQFLVSQNDVKGSVKKLVIDDQSKFFALNHKQIDNSAIGNNPNSGLHLANGNNLNKTILKHLPTCPLFYLNNINNNINNLNMLNHRQKANIHYIPNFFQNSYRVPMHFRNVYYYKSLVNLNMRLMTVKPNKTLVYKNGPISHFNRHHRNIHNQHKNLKKFAPEGNKSLANVSLSCPDLQLNENSEKLHLKNHFHNVKISNNHRGTFIKIPKPSDNIQLIKVRDINTQTPKYYILIKADNIKNAQNIELSSKVLKNNIREKSASRIQKENSNNKINLNSTSKILNAGSIIFKPVKLNNINKRRESGDYRKLKTGENDLNNLSEYAGEDCNLRIKKESLNNERRFNSSKNNDEQNADDEDDDEDDEDEDDDDDEEEDDDDDDDECDNCFTRTKYGSFTYRYIYKPIFRPLKFLYYSLSENLKLFKLFKFCIFALCNFILSFFYESPFYFINSYMTENGCTASQAGTVTAAVGLFSVFSSGKLLTITIYPIQFDNKFFIF